MNKTEIERYLDSQLLPADHKGAFRQYKTLKACLIATEYYPYVMAIHNNDWFIMGMRVHDMFNDNIVPRSRKEWKI